jgi:hypothetical protein
LGGSETPEVLSRLDGFEQSCLFGWH